jgi:hypothetical protein
VDARNADVRALLLDIFQQAKLTNYTLAEDVTGTITIRLTDKPLDDALTLVTSNAQPPLVWSNTDGVYAVKRRPARRADDGDANSVPAPDLVVTASGVRYDLVYPVYLDGEALLRAIELLQPPGLTAAIAYLPANSLLLRFGGNGPLVTGVIGGAGVGPRGGNGAASGPGRGPTLDGANGSSNNNNGNNTSGPRGG